ncbi:MAG: ferredoxin family protein [Chloroflexi bacterium]|nr:ferredoxin family protein [Chloroflexota bacterium]
MRTSTQNTLEYDAQLCIGCGLCSVVCPHGVFGLDGGVAVLLRPDDCMECGACQLNCPTGAIKVDSGVGCAAAMIYAALQGRRRQGQGATACCGSGQPSCCEPAASLCCESSQPSCCESAQASCCDNNNLCC